MSGILFSALVGLVLVYCTLIIFQDYFIARHFRVRGSFKIAKIVDLQIFHVGRANTYLTFVEYPEEGKIIKSVVQMAKGDKVGDDIAILVSAGNYTVRYDRYIPYHLLGKVVISIFGYLILGGGLMVLATELLGGIRWLNILAVILGGVLEYLYYPNLVYNSFFKKDCTLQKMLNKSFNQKFYEGFISLVSIEEVNKEISIINLIEIGAIILVIIVKIFEL
ncbi:MAG: hypothetical protein HDR01_01440 [Lachnospiraceae bacterium]|nr:hypothetical protein [Lachnospiraceae bacterium]